MQVFVDRRSEREALDDLPGAVRAGESRALVVRGEAGVGKASLLEYVLKRSSGFRVVRAGVCSWRWSLCSGASSAPTVILGAAAARTRRIRLTSAVTVLSSANPVRVFEVGAPALTAGESLEALEEADLSRAVRAAGARAGWRCPEPRARPSADWGVGLGISQTRWRPGGDVLEADGVSGSVS